MQTATVSKDPSDAELLKAPPATGERRPLVESLLTGMGALGVSLGCERGASFLSNVLAARLAGAAAFGAYSLALTTANNVAVYAGAGIGTTANRFVGQFPQESPGYRRLLRALALIACSSAALAAVVLWIGARPLAISLVHNAKLAGPLRVAALSAAGFILLECCRGLLIGQRSYRWLVTLSAMVGAGLLLAIPATARFGAAPMLAGQAAAVTIAVAITGWLIFRSLGAKTLTIAPQNGPSVWRVWRFGLVQLGEIIGLNAAGWWVAALVARSDPSMTQMAFFAIANQLRNVSTLVPSLVGQTSFAMLTEESGAGFGGSARVLTVSSMIASLLAAACAGGAMTLLPFVLHGLYGSAYRGAELAAAIAIATVVIHMGSAPTASRITILSLRDSGIINLIWSGFVFAVASRFIGQAGAAAAAATFLAAHLLSMILGLAWLRWRAALPSGVLAASALNLVVAAGLLSVAWLRYSSAISAFSACLASAAFTALAICMVWRLGCICHSFPAKLRWTDLRSGLERVTRRVRA